MNATTIPAKSISPRLNRIKIVSRIFRALILALVVLMSLITVLFLLVAAKTVFGGDVPHSLRISFSGCETKIFKLEDRACFFGDL